MGQPVCHGLTTTPSVSTRFFRSSVTERKKVANEDTSLPSQNQARLRQLVMVDPARAPGRERSSSVPSWHEIVPTGCYNRRDF